MPLDPIDPVTRFEMFPSVRNRMIVEQTRLRSTCLACGAKTIGPVFSLGEQFVNDFPVSLDDRGPKIPLALMVCENVECELVQLSHVVPRDALYRTHYWYRSGVNEMMRQELADIVEWGAGFIGEPAFSVVDIGANDGTLLRAAREKFGKDAWLFAWEPALNMQEALRKVADDIYPEYFPDAADALAGPADLVFSIAMFYDVENPQAFIHGINSILAPNGVWVVQFQDLLSMIQTGGVDCLCHEHLAYYSMKPLCRMAGIAGLELVGATFSKSNGGCLRVAFAKKGADWFGPVPSYSQLERVGVHEALRWFGERSQAVHEVLRSTLLRHASSGRIELLGASTKGNTLLQWLGLGPELVFCANERAPEKFGRLTMTGIPIMGELEEGGVEVARCLRLVLPWHFKQGLLAREKGFLDAGGTLLFPLPHPTIVTKTGETPLRVTRSPLD